MGRWRLSAGVGMEIGGPRVSAPGQTAGELRTPAGHDSSRANRNLDPYGGSNPDDPVAFQRIRLRGIGSR